MTPSVAPLASARSAISDTAPAPVWRTWLLFLVLATGAFLAAMSAIFAANAAATCSIYWTGTTSASWTTATNWSLTDGGGSAGRIPTATDFVCMSTAPTRSSVVYPTGNRTVAGVQFAVAGSVTPSLDVQGGRFTIGSASGAFDSVINNLTVAPSAVLGGTANELLTGSVNLNGSTLDGAGVTTLAAGTSTTTTGFTLDNGRRLVIAGTLTHSGCAGYVVLAKNSVLDNAGTFNAAADCGYYLYDDDSAGAQLINRAGATVTVTVPTGNTYYVGTPIDNAGSITATGGDLTYDTLQLDGTGAITSSGTGKVLGVSGSTLNSDAGSTIGSFTLQGGTLTGEPTVTALTSDGGTFTGGGTMTVPAGSTATIRGLTVNSASTLLNQGTLNHSGCNGYVYLANNSVMDNAGTFNAAADCGYYLYDDDSAGAQLINRAGATVTVTVPTGNTYLFGTPIDNAGNITTTSGNLTYDTMHLDGTGAITSSGTGKVLGVSGSTLNSDPGSTIDSFTLQGGTLTGDPTITALTSDGGTFTGGGTMTIPAAGTATILGLTVDGGSTLLNQGTVNHTGCSGYVYLANNSVLDNAGAFTATSTCGYYLYDDNSAGAQLINRAGATITVTLPTTTANYLIDTRVTNQGTVTVTKGLVSFNELTNLVGGTLTGGSFLATSGTIQFPADVTTNAATLSLGATGAFTNSFSGNALTTLTTNTGSLTLAKSLTTNKVTTNSGIVTVTAGTYQPTSYTQSGGLTTIASGATLRAGSGGANAVVISGGTLAGAGTVAGNVSGGGTIAPGAPTGPLTVSGSYAPASGGTLAITVNGSTAFSSLSVSGAATVAGTLSIATATGLTPPLGTTYTILTAATRTGTFSTVSGQNPPNGTYYEVNYTATSVTLTVRAIPTISVNDASVTEGDSGSTPLGFTVSLDIASSQVVQVDYATADGTAIAGSDYVATSGTLTFPAGTTSLPVTVQVQGDLAFEPDEDFSLVLSTPVRAALGDATGSGLILNDDPEPAIPTVSSVSPSALGQGATNRQLTITGTNFVSTSQVTFSGSGITIASGAFVDSTTLLVNVNVTGTATVSARDVTVTNPDVGSATCTGCLSVTAKPQATSATPALAQGAVQRTVVVTGSNFAPGVVVRFTGSPGVTGRTSFVSSTTLEVSVTVAKTAVLRTYNVQAINRDGGSSICSGCFTVIAAPTVTAVSPSTVARGTTTLVTITGTGFVPGAQVLGPPGIGFDGIAVVNSTTITAELTISSTRATGTNIIMGVINPASGGYGSGTCNCLTITA